MCAQYLLKLSPEELVRRFHLQSLRLGKEELSKDSWRFYPKSKAPVIHRIDNAPTLELMEFGLVPLWDKEKKKRFHNARVESIEEKPSFKKHFIQNHCLVPMSGFFEYIWTSDSDNWLAQFSLGKAQDEVLFAAGIFNSLQSFSIITMPPSPFILQTGHDRSPLFLKADRAFEWLESENEEAEDLKTYLRNAYYYPDFQAEKIDKTKKIAGTRGQA